MGVMDCAQGTFVAMYCQFMITLCASPANVLANARFRRRQVTASLCSIYAFAFIFNNSRHQLCIVLSPVPRL
jgi:hypothetical protein